VKRFKRTVLWSVPVMALLLLFVAIQKQFWQGDDREPALASWQPSEKDVRAAAEKLDQAFLAGDANALNVLVAPDIVLRRATAIPHVPQEVKSAFLNETGSRQSIVQDVVQAVGRRGSYRLIHVYPVGKRYHALFRLLSENGRVNYHELVFSGLYESGVPVVRVVDIGVFSTGEMLSESLRRDFLAYILDKVPQLVPSLHGLDQQYCLSLKQLDTMGQFYQEGHPEEALKIFDRLPPLLQQQGFVLQPALRIAGSVSHDELTRLESLFRKSHPGSPVPDLTLLRLYQEQGNQQAILDVLARLQKIIPGDVYPSAAEGVILYQMGEKDQGFQMVFDAVKKDPMIWVAYPVLLDHMVMQKDHARTAGLLSEMRIRFGMDVANLENDPRFSDFIKSEHYAP
jgi:hypothetical protein